MENKNIENVEYDYFSNSPSYVRTILDMLPENIVPTSKKRIIRDIYNRFLNISSENEIREITAISILFDKKIKNTRFDELLRLIKFTYEIYIERMLNKSCDCGMLFDQLKDSMRSYVDYQSYVNELEGVSSTK